MRKFTALVAVMVLLQTVGFGRFRNLYYKICIAICIYSIHCVLVPLESYWDTSKKTGLCNIDPTYNFKEK